MKRYELWPGGQVMLVIDEGDPSPTMQEVNEADRLRAAIRAGDPRIEIAASDDGRGVAIVFWSPMPIGEGRVA